MSDDINFLSSKGKSDADDAAKKKLPPTSDELAMHVPPPEPPKEKKSDLLADLKNITPKSKGPEPEDIFHSKLSDVASSKETSAPKMPLPPPAPPRPNPPRQVPPAVAKPVAAKLPVSVPVGKPSPPMAPMPMPSNQKNGSVLRVSLISSTNGSSLSELAIRDRVRTFWLAVLLIFVVNGLAYGGLLYARFQTAKHLADAEANIQTLDQQIADLEAKTARAKNLQQLLGGAEEALKNHRHWTNVLAFIEDIAKPQVQFNNLSGAESGVLVANIVAKDYTTLAQQILVLQHDPRVKKVTFGGASGSVGQVSTTINLQVDPSILLAGARQVASATSTP